MIAGSNMNVRLIVLMFTVLLVASGCGDDEDPVRVETDPPIGPESTAELVTQFMAAYEAKDVEKYLALLDPDYLMILSDETIFRFPDVGPTLDFAEEERIHKRMFSGKSVTDPLGDLIPGVLAIGFGVFKALDDWSPSDNEDRFPGAVWAPFQVELLFDRGQNFSTLKFGGTVKFYARSHEIMVGDTEKTVFLMAGMVDLTYLAKGVEDTPWGVVKALYR